jgi:tetratricopeptide (TPR) repeat protein
VEFSENAGGPFRRIFAYAHLGHAYFEVGSYAEAVTALEKSREIVRESHTGFEMDPAAATWLAEVYAYSGEPERALQLAEEAVIGARGRGVVVLAWTRIILARVLLRTKGLASRREIEASLDEASGLVRQMEFRMTEPFLHVERAELARLTGNEAARQRELREAHRLFTEIGAPIRAAEVSAPLAG